MRLQHTVGVLVMREYWLDVNAPPGEPWTTSYGERWASLGARWLGKTWRKRTKERVARRDAARRAA